MEIEVLTKVAGLCDLFTTQDAKAAMAIAEIKGTVGKTPGVYPTGLSLAITITEQGICGKREEVNDPTGWGVWRHFFGPSEFCKRSCHHQHCAWRRVSGYSRNPGQTCGHITSEINTFHYRLWTLDNVDQLSVAMQERAKFIRNIVKQYRLELAIKELKR